MKSFRLLQSAIIASVFILTLTACGSDSDDDSDNDTGSDSSSDSGNELGNDSGNTADNLTTDNNPDINTDNTPTSVLLFDEANDGDIASDPNNPQPFQLVVGENRITAEVDSTDLDYVTVNIPAGSELTAIELAEYESLELRSFIAIQAGSVFTESPSAPAIENLLGFVHFGANLVGTDILATMGVAEGTQGFTPPLEDGDYSFWIQETGTNTTQFSMNFIVEPSN